MVGLLSELILTSPRTFLDKEWTKEETDYLFSFAKDYDTRWYIIHDRYNFPNGPQRTLEVRFPKFKSLYVS